MMSRGDKRMIVSRDIRKVLDAADQADVDYRFALGFFSELDWQQIGSGIYTQEHLKHVLQEQPK